MPKGSRGENRPTDVIGAAAKIMKVVTGEIAEDQQGPPKNPAAVELASRPRAVATEPDADRVDQVACSLITCPSERYEK